MSRKVYAKLGVLVFGSMLAALMLAPMIKLTPQSNVVVLSFEPSAARLIPSFALAAPCAALTMMIIWFVERCRREHPKDQFLETVRKEANENLKKWN